MAYDIILGKVTADDWSCGIDVDDDEATAGSPVAARALATALGIAVFGVPSVPAVLVGLAIDRFSRAVT